MQDAIEKAVSAGHISKEEAEHLHAMYAGYLARLHEPDAARSKVMAMLDSEAKRKRATALAIIQARKTYLRNLRTGTAFGAIGLTGIGTMLISLAHTSSRYSGNKSLFIGLGSAALLAAFFLSVRVLLDLFVNRERQ